MEYKSFYIHVAYNSIAVKLSNVYLAATVMNAGIQNPSLFVLMYRHDMFTFYFCSTISLCCWYSRHVRVALGLWFKTRSGAKCTSIWNSFLFWNVLYRDSLLNRVNRNFSGMVWFGAILVFRYFRYNFMLLLFFRLVCITVTGPAFIPYRSIKIIMIWVFCSNLTEKSTSHFPNIVASIIFYIYVM